MAKKKAQNISLEDLMKLGPKKIIMIIIAAVIVYFFGGENFLTQTLQDDSGFTTGIVTRVVDGDTAVIKVDGNDIRVRMLGVDTPETVHPNKPMQFYGKEASTFTKDYLNGKQVWLQIAYAPTVLIAPPAGRFAVHRREREVVALAAETGELHRAFGDG